MTEPVEPQVSRDGIHIDRDVADAVRIEEELDSNVVGPYQFPPPTRRRISGWVYLVGAAICLVAINSGWVPALGFGVLAAWQFASSWPLTVDEHQALAIAGRSVDFPVGHASAAVTFEGLRSRPRWSVVLYSASEPPDKRALVVVDAVDGSVDDLPYLEDVPTV